MFSSTAYLAPILVILIRVSCVCYAYGETDCSKLNRYDGNKENVLLSKGHLPIRINLSGRVYGNQETIKVNIGDALNSRFSIEMRSIDTNQRVGRFRSWPNSVLQPLFCKGSNQSILATTRPLNSSDASFYWQSPHSDKGTLALMGTFIKDKEYWIVKKDGPKIFYRLARRKREIPMNLVCYEAGALCLEEECGYVMVYELVDRQTLKIYMEGVNVKHHVSLLVAITRNTEKELDDSIIVTCTLNPGKGVKAKSYLSMKEKYLFSKRIVDVDDNLFTCDLLISLEDLKERNGEPLRYAHFWSQVDQNNGRLILPKNKRVGILFQPLLKQEAINISCHTSSSRSELSQANGVNVSSLRFLNIWIAFIIICLSLCR